MPIKQSKSKNPDFIPGKQCVSYMRIQALIDAQKECERCIKAANAAHSRMVEAHSMLTPYDWKVFERLSQQLKERGEQA